MAFQITGKLEFVGETIARTPKNGGNPFYRREFVIDCTRWNPETGDPWENHPKFELSGNNCTLLDQFRLGQRITVDFSLRGARYQDQQTGETKYFTSISAFKVALAEQQANNQPPSAYQQAVVPQEDQPFPPLVNENGLQGNDDLPF